MKIKNVKLPDNCRILAISDIHTHYDVMDRLLKKAYYNPKEDYLVIVGDILEHGEENLKTLEYIKKLSDNSDKCYVLMGNNDFMCVEMAYIYDFKDFQRQFYRNDHNTFRQMARNLDFKDCREGNWLEIREKVLAEYKEEIEFIRDFPTCLETDDFVFVHAGVENRPDWRNTDDIKAITMYWFLREENPTGKWLVCGHYPTYNYSRCQGKNLPVIDNAKKMIDIDGGMTIKQAGQVNLLVITKNNSDYTFESLFDTDAPKFTVLKDFSSKMTPLYVDWKNQDIEIIDDSDYLVRLRDNYTGFEGVIPKNQVYYFDEKPHIYQFMSAFPTVKKGEQVFVFYKDEKMVLVIQKDGQVGWIPVEIIEEKEI